MLREREEQKERDAMLEEEKQMEEARQRKVEARKVRVIVMLLSLN